MMKGPGFGTWVGDRTRGQSGAETLRAVGGGPT